MKKAMKFKIKKNKINKIKMIMEIKFDLIKSF